jgi:hypothetical protein
MKKKNIRDYKEFGRLIAEYRKFPDKILELAQREMKE